MTNDFCLSIMLVSARWFVWVRCDPKAEKIDLTKNGCLFNLAAPAEFCTPPPRSSGIRVSLLLRGLHEGGVWLLLVEGEPQADCFLPRHPITFRRRETRRYTPKRCSNPTKQGKEVFFIGLQAAASESRFRTPGYEEARGSASIPHTLHSVSSFHDTFQPTRATLQRHLEPDQTQWSTATQLAFSPRVPVGTDTTNLRPSGFSTTFSY
jgi:hypothetical protein